MKKILLIILILLSIGIILFAAIQLIPYGHDRTNPKVVSEPKWDSPQTRQLTKRACFDCHSNETVWPWYSYVAPVSWLLQNDIDEGRSTMNLSDWANYSLETGEIVRQINSGKMPPSKYLMMHPEARLTQAEKEQLIQGITRALGNK